MNNVKCKVKGCKKSVPKNKGKGRPQIYCSGCSKKRKRDKTRINTAKYRQSKKEKKLKEAKIKEEIAEYNRRYGGQTGPIMYQTSFQTNTEPSKEYIKDIIADIEAKLEKLKQTLK